MKPRPGYEPIEPGDRKAIPAKVKLAVFERDGGKCIRCGSKTMLQYEHRVAHALGGEDTVDNLDLMCSRPECHPAKTSIDRKMIAKAKGLAKKDRGEKKPSNHKIVNRGFDKTKTKKFSGQVVPRNR